MCNREKIEVCGQKIVFGSSERMGEVLDETVNFFITSPPYWNLKNYGGAADTIGNSSYEVYLKRLNCVWQECYRKGRDNAVLVININTRRYRKRYYPIPIDIASRMRGWVLWDMNVWYIPNALPQPNSYMERLLDNKYETLLVFVKDGRADYKFHKPRVPQKYSKVDPREHKRNKRGRCLGNIIRIPAYRPPNVKKLGYHVAAYPEELIAFFLQIYTDPGDVVLDPFLGSGTTLKVARVMGRTGIGYETNRDFCGLIRKKIQENWEVPDWRQLDIIHSTNPEPGMKNGPRKIHFLKKGLEKKAEASLFTD